MSSHPTWGGRLLFAAGLLTILAGGSVWADNQPVHGANYPLVTKFSNSNLRQFVYDSAVTPHWIGKTDSFWYSYRTSGGTKFYRVNPKTSAREPLFDQSKVAAQLSEMVQKPLEALELPISRGSMNDEGTKFKFVTEDMQYEYDLPTEKLTKLGKAPPQQAGPFGPGGGRRGFGGRRGDQQQQQTQQQQQNVQQQQLVQQDQQQIQQQQQNVQQQTQQQQNGQQQTQQQNGQRNQVQQQGQRGQNGTRGDGQGRGGRRGQAGGAGQPGDGYRAYSPDRKYLVYAQKHNLYLAAAGKEKEAVQLTKDGVEDYSFGGGNTDAKARPFVSWSPDSKAFYIRRQDSRNVKELYLVSSLATPRPTLEKYKYPMPGEEAIRRSELYTCNPADKKLVKIEQKWKDESFGNVHWGKTAEDLRFVRNDRLRRHLEFCSLDALKGKCTCLVAEGFENASVEQQPVHYLDDSGEMIWWSERSGWGHYYLYDRGGKLKNAITSGAFRASRIVDVDAKNRLLYFNANGREPGENIYHQHLYCVHFDGSGLTLLDPGAANHNSVLSPTKQFLVDNSSAVDKAPVSVLRDAQGKQLMVLGECDLSRLKEIGWRLPETFMVKAADGVTDLYGNMWKPFDFDPKKKYPIIANVYPGPQMEGVNGTFSAVGVPQELAQLGFIVIQVGHRGGTPARSKAYQRFGYYNLRDYGLADKKSAIEQLAGRFPFIDIERVGIYGHSGGGFMSAAAMMQKPYNEFFKAAVASSGNHDNNIYNDAWAEHYHGLKEVVIKQEDSGKKVADADKTGAGDAGTSGGGAMVDPPDDDYAADWFNWDMKQLEEALAGDVQPWQDDAKKAQAKKDAGAQQSKKDEKKVETKKEEVKKADAGKDAKKDEKKADVKKEDVKKADAGKDVKKDEKKVETKKEGGKEEKKAAPPLTKFEIKVPTNAELAENLRGRILLVHGDMDNNVHPANTMRLVDALIKANKRFDMLIIPGKRHGYGDYQPYFNRRMYDFFAESLLGERLTNADLLEKPMRTP
jgi:dipeptidyl aminopeptidase/acylaminoacyl peptidase